MHDTTRAVRELYERYPYPSGPHSLRMGFDVRRTLSMGRLDRQGGRPLHVLDAGCSRGVGLIGAAQAQPDVQFTGVDVNRIALQQAREEADRRGIQNLNLLEVNLETLSGLQVPEGGFDVIISSGVLHHLVDPVGGLLRLQDVLAPHGVMDIMVYAAIGRRGLEAVAREIERQVMPGPLDERLATARELALRLAPHDPNWAEAASEDDVEFVDRYLHPSYVSYDLDGLWGFLRRGGMQQVAWVDQDNWRSQRVPQGTSVPRDLHGSSRVIEPFTKPRKYMVYATKIGNGARARPDAEQVEAMGWAINPEGTLSSGTRQLWSGAVPSGFTWSHPTRSPVSLSHGPAAIACQYLLSLGRPFRGHELVAHLRRHGVTAADARRLLLVLHAEDVLWSPHEADLRQALPARLHGLGLAV